MESESRMENEWEKKCIKVKINRIINLCSSVRPAEEHENRKKDNGNIGRSFHE